MQNLIPEIASLKISRLAILVITVFIFVDLLPHPLLPPGIIAMTLSKAQQTFTKGTSSRTSRI